MRPIPRVGSAREPGAQIESGRIPISASAGVTRRRVRWSSLLPLFIVAAGLCAYHDSFRGPFVFDDIWAIVHNPTIRRVSLDTLRPPPKCAVAGRPVVNLSLALTYALAGLDVAAYRIGNLAIHLLVALALYGVVRRTLLLPRLRPRYGADAAWLAGVVALLWVVHPLASEGVLYVIQRTESLGGLFFVLTLYCVIRGAESPRSTAWYAAASVAFALGAGSKEFVLTATVVLLVYDQLLLCASMREVVRRRGGLYAALVAVTVLYVVVAGARLEANLPRLVSSSVTPWAYLKTQSEVIVHYLRLAIWPHPLAADYSGWAVAGPLVTVLPSAVAVLALLGVTLWAWHRRWPVAVVGVWVFALLAPTSSVWPFPNEIAAERRMYLPLAGVVVLIVFGADALLRRAFPQPGGWRRRVVAGLSVLAAAGVLAGLTIRRCDDYRSPTAFWSAIVATRPTNVRARLNLGNVYATDGRTEAAREQYGEAVRLEPDNAQAHYGLGVVLATAGRTGEAEAQYQQALQLEPDYAEAHDNLGIVLANRGDNEAAGTHFRAALRSQPDNGNAHYNLGVILLRLGQPDAALTELEAAVRLRPDFAAARQALADAQRALARRSKGSP